MNKRLNSKLFVCTWRHWRIALIISAMFSPHDKLEQRERINSNLSFFISLFCRLHIACFQLVAPMTGGSYRATWPHFVLIIIFECTIFVSFVAATTEWCENTKANADFFLFHELFCVEMNHDNGKVQQCITCVAWTNANNAVFSKNMFECEWMWSAY